jgi:hypothetical protein
MTQPEANGIKAEIDRLRKEVDYFLDKHYDPSSADSRFKRIAELQAQLKALTGEEY